MTSAFAAGLLAFFAATSMTAAADLTGSPASADVAAADAVPSVVSPREEARQLGARGKWAEAAVVLKGALRQNPDDYRASLELSQALFYANRREEAVNALNAALSRENRAGHAALVRRVQVLSRMFVTNEDFQSFQDGLHLMIERKFAPARERFVQVLHAEPANVEVLTRIGQSLVLDGDFDNAAERLRLAKRLNPYEPEIRLWLGRALHERGELSEAVEELRTAESGLKSSELAPVWLSEALASLGQRTQAAQVLEADIVANPLHLRSLISLAQLKLQGSDRDEPSLIDARKKLQLAQSRLEAYHSPDTPRFESALGLELTRDPKAIHDEIQSLFDKVDARISVIRAEESG